MQNISLVYYQRRKNVISINVKLIKRKKFKVNKKFKLKKFVQLYIFILCFYKYKSINLSQVILLQTKKRKKYYKIFSAYIII